MVFNWFIIINPCSGKNIYRRRLKQLKSALYACNQTCEFELTKSEGHAVELAQKALDKGYKQLVVMGGDGTINEVINGVLSSDITSTEDIVIAAVPTGTGNDWIRQWNINKKTNLNDYFQSGKRILVDVGSVEEKKTEEKHKRYFINAFGLGFDGDVVYRAELLRNWVGARSWTYVASVFFSVFKLRYKQLCVETEKERINNDVLTICIGNGCYSGGGLLQTPKADPCDGLFDMMLVQRIRFRDIPSLLNHLLKGKMDIHPKVKSIKSSMIIINSDQSVRCETDGVLLNLNFPIEIKIIPKKIQFLIPS